MSGFQSYPSLNPFTSGLRVNNPRPLDANEGPWFASGACGGFAAGTTSAGVALVNLTVSPTIRYVGQKVVIIAASNPGGAGVTQAYYYWYRGGTGDGDLVEFASGAATSSEFATGISAAGATFSRLVSAQAGISASFLYVSGGATFATQQITALAGISTASLYSSGLGSFVGGLTASGIYASTGSTFAGTAYFTSGVTTNTLDVTGRAEFAGGVTFDTTGVFGITGGVTFAASNIPAGTSLGTGFALVALGNAALNGNVLIGPSGGIVTGGPTAASVIVRSGTTFEKPVTFASTVTAATFSGNLTGNVTGNADTATTATTANNALNLAGISGASYARRDAANTFTVLQTFSSGITMAGGGFSGSDAQFSGLVHLTGTNGLSAAGGATFAQVVNAPTFKGALVGNADTATTATTATTANNAWNLDGISGASYAKLSTENIFGANNTFNENVTVGKTLTVQGNFYVTGTLTTVNRSELSVDDISILLAGATATTMTDSLANDGGIKLQGGSVKSILWKNTLGGQWESSENFNLATGKSYRIAGTTLLASTFLGSAVVGSSLASVGTLTNGVWNATAIGLAYGGVGGNISAVATNGLLYKTASGVTASLAGSNTQVLSADNDGVPTWVNITGLTVGTANKIKVADANTTNSVYYLSFLLDSGDAADLYIDKSNGITYNASTNLLSCRQLEALIDGGSW